MFKALILLLGLSKPAPVSQSFPCMHYDTVGKVRVWIRMGRDGSTTVWTQKIGSKERKIHVIN